MYKLCYYRYVNSKEVSIPYSSNTIMDFFYSFFFASRFVETDGKGFDRARRYEIGRKHFKLTHFEEVKSFGSHNPPRSFA
jgi:hypothetical protein